MKSRKVTGTSTMQSKDALDCVFQTVLDTESDLIYRSLSLSFIVLNKLGIDVDVLEVDRKSRRPSKIKVINRKTQVAFIFSKEIK